MSIISALENGRTSNGAAVSLGGLALLKLSFEALGIIYSDIGTSPLYVLNGIWPSSGPLPSNEDIIGGVSAIIWSLTLAPLIKYVFITLAFGTQEGEGGTFALYQGLYPPEDKDFDGDRTLTGDSYMQEKGTSSTQTSRLHDKMRWPLLIWALFGTALTMSDGIFTPAVSVTSAVGGIAVAKPSVTENIVPVSIAIIAVLFVAQQFGTTRIAATFAPISFVWFLLLLGTGIYNTISFPGIFRAFDPSRAIMLFVRTKNYDMLAGVLLAVTGCEAIFANLGQFNAMSIRLSFGCFVYPSLIIAYLGQGARLIVDGEEVLSNIFYHTIPGPVNGPLFWIVFVVAILATIIASQALITATFSLIQQVVNMKSMPPLRMYCTSDSIKGRVYIPFVNWVLMIGVIVLVAAFSNLTALTNGYGFAVATVMFSTTVLIAVQMYYVKRWSIFVVSAFFIVFGFVDGLFWGASLKKVPTGAWVPLMLGTLLLMLMWLWTWARGLEDEFDGSNRHNLRHFIFPDEKLKIRAVPVDGDEIAEEEDPVEDAEYQFLAIRGGIEEKRALARIPTCALFHKISQGRGVPHTFIGLIRQWPALPEVLIFLSVCTVPVARVPLQERYAVAKVRTLEGFYGVTYFCGFRDDFDVQVDQIINGICTIEEQMNPVGSAATIERIRKVAENMTHVVPHYHVVSKSIEGGRLSPVVHWARKCLIEDIYRRLSTIFPDTANWLTPADEIIHVGINAVI
ncbi:potassium transporter [Mycena floridula]|nr:potassium transporter [Mycena floridula]